MRQGPADAAVVGKFEFRQLSSGRRPQWERENQPWGMEVLEHNVGVLP